MTGDDAAGCTHYHVAQFSLPFPWLRVDYLLDLALLSVPFRSLACSLKTYSLFYSKFCCFSPYVLLPSSTRLVAGLIGGDVIAYINGVVVGCWVRVGFRLWFNYTQHQVISPSMAVYRCITSHPIMTSSPRHECNSIYSMSSKPVCTQQLPLCNCSTSGAPALVLSSHCPLNFLGASPSTGRLRCV